MPRRMSAKNRERVMELVRANPEDLGPQFGLMSIKYNLPPEALAQQLDVSLSTIYTWFYGMAKPHESSLKNANKLLVILRRALLAHEFPLEGTNDKRIELLNDVIRRHMTASRR